MKILLFTLLVFISMPALAEDRPAPLFKNLKQQEADPCNANDLKQFMEGSFVITGYKKSGNAIPTPEEMYAGAATARLYECALMVKRCVGGVTETGEIKKIVAMDDAITMWKIDTTTQSGEAREYRFQMESSRDNYPVLFGGSADSYEFWRFDPDENASCQ
ncbi:MAG: hypothetical protein DYH13_10020 [Alphaproteobacteria bacterium PRO2]|nr:hypothetical protein [Alphaproteobacteria bacterium PRO2]